MAADVTPDGPPPRRFCPVRLAGRVAYGSGCTVCFAVRVVLYVLLLAQAFFALAIGARWEFPVPALVRQWVDGEAARLGLSLEWRDAAFDLAGNLRVDGAVLRDRAAGDILARVPGALVEISLWRLAAGQVYLREIVVDEGELWVPAAQSPSGVNAPWIGGVSLRLRQDGRRWLIDRARARWDHLELRAGGIYQPAPRDPAAPPFDYARARALYAQAAGQAQALTPWLALLRAPAVQLSLRPHGADGTLLDVEAIVAAVELENAPDGVPLPAWLRPWQAGGLELRAAGLDLVGQGLPRPVELKVASLVWPGEGEVRQVAVTGLLPPLRNLRLPNLRPLILTVGAVSSRGETVRDLRLDVAVHEFPTVRAGLLAAHRESLLELRAQADFSTGEARAELFTNLDITYWLNLPWVPYADRVRHYFHFPRGPRAWATANVGPGWHPQRADFRCELPGGDLRGFPFQWGAVEGFWEPGRLVVPEFVVEAAGQRLAGSYEEDLVTHRYRLGLRGHAFPGDLNGYFSEWWRNLWAYFTLSAPIEADLRVWGQWRNPLASGAEGSLALRSFAFRGVEADSADTWLRVNPSTAAIEQLRVRRGAEERIDGRLGYHGVPGVAGNYALALNLDTRWALPDLLAVAEAEPLANDFVLAEDLPLRLGGWFGRSGPTAENEMRFAIGGQAAGVVEWRGLPLGQPRIKLRLDGPQIVIPELSFNYGGGRAWVSVETASTPQPPLALQLRLENVEYTEFMRGLNLLPRLAGGPPPAEPPKTSAEAAATVGQLDLEAALRVVGGDPATLAGNGRFVVREADFGRFQMFGLLSRMLQGGWVGFSTIELNQAEGVFQLGPNRVEFPSIEVSGPINSILARGSISIPAKELNFAGKILLFERSTNVVTFLFSPLLRGLTKGAVDLRMDGTLDDPKLRVKFFDAGDTPLLRLEDLPVADGSILRPVLPVADEASLAFWPSPAEAALPLEPLRLPPPSASLPPLVPARTAPPPPPPAPAGGTR